MKKIKSTKRALLMSALALLLCISMLVGSTYAWFTDSVTSAGNIIKSGTLEVEMYWANGKEALDSATWTDASEGAIFNNNLWEPGYVEAKHIKIANVGSLALSYQLRVVANGTVSKLGDVIDVYYFDNATQLTRETVAQGTRFGTLTEMFGAEKNLSNAVYGDLLADEEKFVTIAFKMQESAANEYQGLSIGSDFSVELTAVQHTYEKDSFDENYDKNALSNAVPAALVKELENKNISATLGIGGAAEPLTLDTAYQFQPSESFDKLMESEYKYYMADFIVSADKDVPAGSIALAGYYHAWCDLINDGNWFALVNDGLEVKAGKEIALLEGMGYPVHYKDILQFGNDGTGFLCGAADLTGANAGTTLTVKLCLFETTADPNGGSASDVKVQGVEPIVIGEFKYTFPAVKVANQAKFNEAVAKSIPSLELAPGNYSLSSGNDFRGKTIKISGTKDVVFNDQTLSVNNQFVTGAKLVFDGVTVNFGTADYLGLANTESLTFKNCTINGYQYLYGDNITFENCEFNSTGYAVCAYDARNVTFKKCTFNTAGKALLLYKDDLVNYVCNVIVEGCTFNASAAGYAGAITNQPCAAIEIDNYGASYNVTTSGNTSDSDFSGEWRIKSFSASKGTVTVNGTAYTQTALDGKLMTVTNKEATVA